MQNINNDLTLKRNYIRKYRFLIGEYEQVKHGEHLPLGLLGISILPMIPMQERS